MSAIRDRLSRFFQVLASAISGRRAVSPARRKVDGRVGPMTRRYMVALEDILSSQDWDSLTSVGMIESRLADFNDRLRPIAPQSGRAAEVARSLRLEIDHLLSESSGSVAATSAEFPCNDRGRALRNLNRLQVRVDDLAVAADGLLEASVVTGSAGAQLRRVRSQFEAVLPGTCEALGLASMEEQLRNATTVSTAARLFERTAQCETLLVERYEVASREAADLEVLLASLYAAPSQSDNADLEARVEHLRNALQLAADAACKDVIEATHATADLHVARITVGAAAERFRGDTKPTSQPARKQRVTPSAVDVSSLKLWAALRRLRVIPSVKKRRTIAKAALKKRVKQKPAGDP